MMATVRNRRGVVNAVDAVGGTTGDQLHLATVAFSDPDGPAEETLIWEREAGAALLEPTALPDVTATAPMAPDVVALLLAADGSTATRATVSLLAGPEPEVVGTATVDDEIAAVADWIRRLVSQGFRPEEIAIFGRTEAVVRERARLAVRQSGQADRALSDEGGADGAGIGVGTMHRAKGLEFRAVAVMACDASTVPLAFLRTKQADEVDREAYLEQERNLLYVACTRARERLLITYKGRPSPLLENDRLPTLLG